MYTIIKMVSNKHHISLWKKIKAWFLREPLPQEPFLELSYDPSSGYLFFSDTNAEHEPQEMEDKRRSGTTQT